MLSILYKSDGNLVRRTLRGHREAFSTLVTRHQELVFAVAYGIVANASDAEDVTQDTFVTAFTKLTSLREPEKFRAWILTIARNRSSDILVKRRRETPLEDADIPAPAASDPVADAELRALLRDRIERLPAEHREILLLHYYAGLKVRDIAAELGISPEAAKKRLQRARDLLSQRMLAQLRDTVEEQGSSTARTRAIVGVITGMSAPWLGVEAAAAGTGLLSAGMVFKFAASAVVAAGVVTAVVVSVGTPEPVPPPESTAETTALVQTSPLQTPAPTPETAPVASPEPVGEGGGDSAAIPDPVGEIQGRVLSDAGAPLAGIRVTADSGIMEFTDHHETVSDEKGSYAFRGLRKGGYYLLQGFGENAFGAAETSAGQQEGAASQEDIVLTPSTELSGLVVDTESRPLAAVPVTPWQVPINGKPEPIGPGWQRIRRVQTDGSGQFTIPYAWPGNWKLEVDVPDYAYLVTKNLSTDLSPHTIRMELGGTVHGRVVRHGTGEVVPHLELAMGHRKTTSDANGSFTIRGVSPTDNFVQVPRESGLLVTSPPFAVFPGRETADVTVEVAVGGVIAGRVTDSDTGDPVQQAWVEFEKASAPGIHLNTMTDETGNYTIAGIAPGEYTLYQVSSSDYAPSDTAESEPIVMDYGTRRDHLDFTLIKGVMVSGTVDFPEGEPREEVYASARYVREDGSVSESRGSSFGGDGSFSVGGLRRSGKVLVQLRGPGWTSNEEGPFDLAQGDVSGIYLKAAPLASTGGSISGRVVQGGNQPRAGETVWLAGLGSGEGQTTQSDADGAFRFVGLPPGSYQVFIPTYNTEIPNVSVQTGRDTGNLVLDIGNGTGTITGRVVDWRGNAVADAEVRAVGSRKHIPDVNTDEAGRYTLSGIGDGDITVFVHAPGFGGEQREKVAADSKNVDFRLKPVGHVEGTVLDARTGFPITEFYVDALRGASQQSIEYALRGTGGQRQVSAEGTFRAINLAAEEHAIIVRAPGYYAGYTKVTVPPAELVTGQTVRLEPSGAFTAKIIDQEGTPIAGAKIFINNIPHTFDNEHFNNEAPQTDEAGIAPLDNLVPGTNTVYVYHPVQGRGVFTVDSQKQHGEIPFVLPAAGHLEGRVTLGGQPLEGSMQVRVEYPSTHDAYWFSRYSAEVGKDGVFRIESLMPGTPTLSLQGGRGIQHTRTLQIVSGVTTSIAIELAGGSGTILVTVQVPRALAAIPVMATAQVDTDEGSFTLQNAANERGVIELQYVPAGDVAILVAGRTESGVAFGRHFSQRMEEGAVIELTADFSAGVTISGTAGNLEADRESYALLIAGEADPALFSNEGYQSELALRVTHQQELSATSAFQFDAVTPGRYTLVLALDNFVKTASQVVDVAGEDLRIDLALP